MYAIREHAAGSINKMGGSVSYEEAQDALKRQDTYIQNIMNPLIEGLNLTDEVNKATFDKATREYLDGYWAVVNKGNYFPFMVFSMPCLIVSGS